MSIAYFALGASTMIAGGGKLVASPSYRRLVADLNWSDDELVRLGAAEVLGGLLILFKPSRRLGGAIVLAASAYALAAEIKAGAAVLATSRAGVLLGALSALTVP
jgi:hypothetical protein